MAHPTVFPLPTEILLEVLDSLCPNPAANPIRIPTLVLPAIEIFSSVCPWWWNAAHSQPRFWKHYFVSLPREVWDGDRFEALIDHLEYYLEYAPPLISCHVTVGPGPGPAYWLRRLFVRYASRLESLILHLSSSTLATFQQGPPLLFPDLNELSIILPAIVQERGRIRLHGLSQTFANVPRLTVLSVFVGGTSRAGSAHRGSFVNGLPLYDTLTRLTVTCIWISATESRRFWVLCPQLESCTLWLSDFGNELGVQQAIVHLARLRELDITYRYLSPEPFVSLSAPQLVILTMSMEANEDIGDFPHEALLAFQTRSNYELTEFHLVQVNFVEQAGRVLAVLEATRSLQRLTLRWTSFLDFWPQDLEMDNLLESMARNHPVTPNTMDILPMLRSLEIDLVSPYEPSVWDILRSRARQLTTVRLYVLKFEVAVANCTEVYRREIEDLHSRHRGLQITFAGIGSFGDEQGSDTPSAECDESSESDSDGSEAGSVSTEATSVAEEDEPPSHSGSSDIFSDETSE
ncbi:hypothetical protein FB45DRAFT_1008476 [Roridomyces roridus]|uniref:F-box domain-containing protein n=1 Tax=Roridomyces roridus TaxID=1738132 RepID=A0AAD7FF14_9AGAR|nr:hypothetical protein FB45DRAFT_1008476 [Roridomyces roridus]